MVDDTTTAVAPPLLTMVGVPMVGTDIDELSDEATIPPLPLAMSRLEAGIDTVGGAFCWMVLTSSTFIGWPSFWADV